MLRLVVHRICYSRKVELMYVCAQGEPLLEATFSRSNTYYARQTFCDSAHTTDYLACVLLLCLF